jgi:methyl-accepting chemotaxis protein
MNKKSLKFQIVGLSVIIIVILGLSSFFLMNKLIKTSEDVSIVDFKSNAMALQSSIAAQFFERYGDVQAFAINPAIVSMDKNKILTFLNQYAVMYGIYDLILVVDVNGNLIATNDIAPDKKELNTSALYAKNFKDEPWFQAALKEQFTDDTKNGLLGTFVEDPHFDENVSLVYGEKRFGSSFSTVIRDAQGKIIGVVSNRAGARWFELECQKLYEVSKTKGYSDLEITLLDKKGVVFVDYDPYTHNNNANLIHDEKILNKLNLAEKGLDIAKNLVNKKSGEGVFLHARKKIQQVAAYTPIIDSKFVSSLNWGVIVRASEDIIFGKVLMVQKIFYIMFSIAMIISLISAYKLADSISKNLQKTSSSLSDAVGEINSTSTGIASSSEELSQAATEQASSLQETSASIEEISSMIGHNTENARKAAGISEQSLTSTEKGKEVVDLMIKSIGDINTSNEGISLQINETNKEIENIVKIIHDIGVKTKVINDIVFQTKLLSFNASVEAARAGEQGKGFSVVAEEVGNLAAMSGAAAQEITQMLDGSIKTVEDIVKKSKERISRLILESKEKVETGTRVAHQCEDVFNDILANISNVSRMVVEISTASQEQAQGVSEVNKAIAQLDQVTHQNTDNASQGANAAKALSIQAEGLNSLVKILIETIEGKKKANSSNTIHYQSAKIVTDSKRPKLEIVKKPSEDFSNVALMNRPIPKKTKSPSSPAVTEKSSANEVPSHKDSRFEDV